MRKKAIITGASQGIGKAIAKLLAEHQYDLYLIGYKHYDNMKEMAADLSSQYGILCTAHQVNVANAAEVSSFFETIEDVDLLINNAGISYVGLLTDMTVDEWNSIIDTNLSSMFYTCKHTIPLMLKKHSGRIINISSIWGNVGASTEVAYSASKGGVNSFTKALAKELAPSNIQVNALALGIMDTAMNQCFSEEELQALCDEIPADRLGLPEEAAQMVLQLAQAPAYLTGQVITLDGGFI